MQINSQASKSKGRPAHQQASGSRGKRADQQVSLPVTKLRITRQACASTGQPADRGAGLQLRGPIHRPVCRSMGLSVNLLRVPSVRRPGCESQDLKAARRSTGLPKDLLTCPLLHKIVFSFVCLASNRMLASQSVAELVDLQICVWFSRLAC